LASKKRNLSKIQHIELKKLYYSIGEVASFFDVNTSLIRFWEKEFSGVKPKKNKKGNRLFTPKDIETLDKIYILVKEKGYTLDGAKKALRDKSTDYKVNVSNNLDKEDLISRLEEIKQKLVQLRNQ